MAGPVTMVSSRPRSPTSGKPVVWWPSIFAATAPAMRRSRNIPSRGSRTISPEPVFLKRDGVRLAHFEAAPKAPQSPPLVLVNGWTGDHGIFTPQIAHFGQTRRVVAVDLRGHGASDAPEQEYTIPGFADDIAWQCPQLGLQKPVVIGHSFAGPLVLAFSGLSP